MSTKILAYSLLIFTTIAISIHLKNRNSHRDLNETFQLATNFLASFVENTQTLTSSKGSVSKPSDQKPGSIAESFAIMYLMQEVYRLNPSPFLRNKIQNQALRFKQSLENPWHASLISNTSTGKQSQDEGAYLRATALLASSKLWQNQSQIIERKNLDRLGTELLSRYDQGLIPTTPSSHQRSQATPIQFEHSTGLQVMALIEYYRINRDLRFLRAGINLLISLTERLNRPESVKRVERDFWTGMALQTIIKGDLYINDAAEKRLQETCLKTAQASIIQDTQKTDAPASEHQTLKAADVSATIQTMACYGTINDYELKAKIRKVIEHQISSVIQEQIQKGPSRGAWNFSLTSQTAITASGSRSKRLAQDTMLGLYAMLLYKDLGI